MMTIKTLRGRSALVTGAARGIGQAIARSLATAGAKVALFDTRENVEEEAAALASETGSICIGRVVDVRDLDGLRAAFLDISAELSGIDILVNNAARTVQCPLWEITPEDWDDVLATNLRSTFFATQMAAVSMRDRGWGRIINLGSLAGQIGGPVAGAHYATSKAGILLINRMWAGELAPHGITVNAIAPGAIDGPIMEIVSPERKQMLADATPLRRLGRMDEIGEVALFLSSAAADYITGATIDVNGGRYMRA